MFSTGTTTDYSRVGTYKITVSSVTLSNGVTYSGTSQIENTASFPDNFDLTVIHPCASATVTASPQTNFSLLAYAAAGNYGSFSEFTYVDSNSATTLCGSFTYTSTYVHGTATNDLTTFYIDNASRNFRVYSGHINQVGTF